MTISFRGFLGKYCKELTSSNTTSLKRLFELADSLYSRAYEPLLLLAICDKREEYLIKQAPEGAIKEKYRQFLSDWKKSRKPLEEYLDTLDERDRFKRPFIAWQAEKLRLEVDRDMLSRVSNAMLALLKRKQITRAQACRIAKVNKGNFYAFLKGDSAKLSRKTAMRIYRQLESI